MRALLSRPLLPSSPLWLLSHRTNISYLITSSSSSSRSRSSSRPQRRASSSAPMFAPSSAPTASPSPAPTPADRTPLVSIGLLSDIQYADVDDGYNFLRTERRFYRHALTSTRRAVSQLVACGCAAVLHLGDLIDGFNSSTVHAADHPQHAGQPLSEQAVRDVMAVLPPITRERHIATRDEITSEHSASGDVCAPGAPMRCYHLLGNHELINFPRSRWAREMGLGALAEDSIREAEQRKQQRQKHPQLQSHQPPANGEAAGSAEPPAQRSFMFPAQPFETSGAVDPPSSASSATASSSESDGAASDLSFGASSFAADSAAAVSRSYSSGAPLYYSLRVGSRFRLLMLDSFDIGISGYEAGHPHQRAAVDFLERENPNEVKYSPLGLVGVEKRKVAFNGGVGQAQLEWARSVLEECRADGSVALLCSHVAFHPGAAHCSALLWNNGEILSLIDEFKGTVVACLHGHDHDGGHHVDHNGVVHHTVPGVLTTPVGSDAYNRLDFFADRIEVIGEGRGKSFVIPMPNRDKQQQQEQQEQSEL